MDQQDVERIARKALKELGVSSTTVTVSQGAQSGVWRIDYGGDRAIKIRCGQGSTPQWVRAQIFEQLARWRRH